MVMALSFPLRLLTTLPETSLQIIQVVEWELFHPMTIKFGLTKEWVNTQFGPVAAVAAYYERQKVLEPLQIIMPAVEKSEFSLANQLTQVMLSILTGCQYLSMVNTRLRPERKLA